MGLGDAERCVAVRRRGHHGRRRARGADALSDVVGAGERIRVVHRDPSVEAEHGRIMVGTQIELEEWQACHPDPFADARSAF